MLNRLPSVTEGVATPSCPPRVLAPQGFQRLLQASLYFAPAFDGAMSNHLPMALHAAWELGADEDRLQALLDHEASKLEPAPAVLIGLPEDARLPHGWLQWRGQRAAYPELLCHFTQALADQPADQVLREHLPALLSGWHAFAFHGVIRVAHAWEMQQHLDARAELAVALANWAAWHETLPAGRQPPAGEALLDIDAWATQLRAAAQGWRSELPMIAWRMQAASQTAVYAQMADRLAPVGSLAQARDRLIALARDAYLHSRNFTLLHLITGLRALRVLSPWLPADLDVMATQALLSRAACAGWLAGRVQWQAVPDIADERHLDWPTLAAAALAQEDEHVIKLVHACWQEDGLSPHPAWRQVAALAQGYRPTA